MLKGWFTDVRTNKIYYFDEQTGAMAHGLCAIPDNGTINVHLFNPSTGVYERGIQPGEHWDYWYENGNLQGVTGRGKEVYDPTSKAWYWLDSLYNGKRAVNKEVMMPYTYNGQDNTPKWVRYDADGRMITGWYTADDGRKYYYDKTTGAMLKGTQEIDGQTYHFDETTGVLD